MHVELHAFVKSLIQRYWSWCSVSGTVFCSRIHHGRDIWTLIFILYLNFIRFIKASSLMTFWNKPHFSLTLVAWNWRWWRFFYKNILNTLQIHTPTHTHSYKQFVHTKTLKGYKRFLTKLVSAVSNQEIRNIDIAILSVYLVRWEFISYWNLCILILNLFRGIQA